MIIRAAICLAAILAWREIGAALPEFEAQLWFMALYTAFALAAFNHHQPKVPQWTP